MLELEHCVTAEGKNSGTEDAREIGEMFVAQPTEAEQES